MNKVFNGVKKFLIGLLLLIVSIIMLIILSPWGLVEIIIGLFWKKRFWKSLGMLGSILLVFATLFDVFGNVVLQFPLNRVFNTSDGYRFGSRFDTISYVLGYGLVHGTLSKSGLKMCIILDKFDPDHCAKTYYGRNPIEAAAIGYFKK